MLCRLLHAWSFQSKLGIISKTILKAAPQLAHLLFVIFNAIALFALLSYLGLGQRVSYASSYAASFEETFRALLGLGYVKLPDIFPPEVALSPPQMLLSLIIYYGRELLFVMIFMQFFMTTLGAEFMELKARTSGALVSSIPADIRQHVLPELKAKAAAALKRARRLRRQPPRTDSASRAGQAADAVEPQPGTAPAVATGTVHALAAPQPQLPELSTSAEALVAFIKAHYPAFVSNSKAFGDKVQAIPIGGHFLDLEALQHLFAQLSLQSQSSLALLQTGPARAFSRRAANAAGSARSSASGNSTAAAAAAAATAGLPAVGRVAVEAGAPAAAVAAAFAAAEQLLRTCGCAVGASDLQEARLGLEQLAEVDVAELQQQQHQEAADGTRNSDTGLQPGRDYTMEVGAML